MKLLNQNQAVQYIIDHGGTITRQAVNLWTKENPLPSFAVKKDGKIFINVDDPEFKRRMKSPGREKKRKEQAKAASKKNHRDIKKITDAETEIDELNYDRLKGAEGGRYFRGALRTAVLRRDGFRCVQCGKTPSDGITLEVDHVVEFEDGGKTVIDNGQTLCSECNKGKHSFKKKVESSDDNEWITQQEFAKRVGAHRNTIADAIDKGIIDYDPVTGKVNFTTEASKWTNRNAIRQPEDDPETSELIRQAMIAGLQKEIYESRIKEEKSKQEEIRTAELKKELAPMYMLKHFFSFAENMVHRSFRRYHEIIPELNALFLAGKLQEAEILLNTELEGIVRESQTDLIKAIKEEGFNEPDRDL